MYLVHANAQANLNRNDLPVENTIVSLVFQAYAYSLLVKQTFLSLFTVDKAGSSLVPWFFYNKKNRLETQLKLEWGTHKI